MPTPSRPMAQRHRHYESTASDLDKDTAYDYNRIVGRHLQHRRLELGMTQKTVAQHIGVESSAISSWELGRGSVPPERYEALAEFLEMDLQEFGKEMLRYTNPWAYAAIFDPEKRDKKLRAEIAALPKRVGKANGR